ncbi:MAG TPA: hydroxymethylglutaryl-CoA lyase [Nevskiaceae bacterium]|nr:hydroxymethylglutaryl-CoA lyase [Nevskiaceae bacterium]
MAGAAVRIVEVGPRDGLQNEARPVATATKIELIRRLAACGLGSIEATSFVSPKWVPQMADAAEVLAGLPDLPGVRLPVLVPNEAGLSRALAAGAREIAVFSAASEAFNRRNINAGIDESLARLRPVVAQARAAGLAVRGYVSTVLGCPYQGAVPLADVRRVVLALAEAGCEEISLGDTIGVGTPRAARAMLEACAAEVGMARLAVHFHDTYGQALANVAACLEAGVRVVDASVAGLGGCPYAAGASGNLATEDLLWMLQGLGLDSGVDLDALCDTARWINQTLGRAPVSRLARIDSRWTPAGRSASPCPA